MPAHRWIAFGFALATAVVLAPASGLLAQSVPIQATIFFKNPPPGAIPSFGSSTPITIVVQVQNISGSQIVTTQGFSRTDFYRLLYFTLNQTGKTGPTIVNTGGAPLHQHVQVGQCLSLNVGGASVPQTPAIPVVPVEIVPGPPGPFFVEYTIPDARQFYSLTIAGRYNVTAIIPFSAFSSTPNTLITNCENFSGSVLNVGGLGTDHQDFTVVSNTLDFRLCCFTFVGFAQPLGSESTCSANPCLRTNFGNTVPVKFALFDTSGAVVRDAVATISVVQISGAPPPTPPTDLGQGSQPTNTFKLSGDQYVFNLYTGVLAPGVWKLNVATGDGSVHSALIQLR
jgi:hypothetical protein